MKNKDRKTKQLQCIVTGRKLNITRDYFDRKVEKFGSESAVYETYVCKEAKLLLQRGHNVEKIRDMLDAGNDKKLTEVPQKIIDKIILNIKSKPAKINNYNGFDLTAIHPKTDPDVAVFLKNVL